MPKLTLTFTLPEEREEWEIQQKAIHNSIVISELDNFLRSKLKHGDLTDEQYHCYEEVRSKLWELNNED